MNDNSLTKEKPIRILHIVGRMDPGGIETMIMNIYRKIDRNKIQFDFLAHYGREAKYNNEIRSLGGKIYEMPALKTDDKVYYWKIFEYKKALNKFFKDHKEYSIIHGHMTNTASIYMPIAKKHGVKVIISHSHNTKAKKGLPGVITNILQKNISRFATDFFSCSIAAAHWIYPKKLIDEGKINILANAVDAEKFRFNKHKRIEMRKKLGIQDKLVICNVARFRPEKNQQYLIKVLEKILKYQENAVLLFVGDGPNLEKIKTIAKDKNLSDKVMFLGSRPDVDDLLQAADIFCLPSLWEGLPVTGIEAQASGLYCVVSDTITHEMDVINNVKYLPLNNNEDEWANKILELTKLERKDTYSDIVQSGYDVNTTSKWLQDYYLGANER